MEFPAVNLKKMNRVYLRGEGQYIKGVFRGNPVDYRVHWIKDEEAKVHKVVCIQKGCPHCASGDESDFMFSVNFINKNDNGDFQASIYEGKWGAYTKLKALNQQAVADKVALEDVIVKIEKVLEENPKTHKTYMNDKFTMEAPMKDEVKALVNVVQLIDLGNVNRNPESDNDIPF